MLKLKLNCNPLFFFFEALEKIKPIVGLRFIRKKLKASRVLKVSAIPFILIIALQYQQAIVWFIKSTMQRSEKNLILKLFAELYFINVCHSSLALKKKID